MVKMRPCEQTRFGYRKKQLCKEGFTGHTDDLQPVIGFVTPPSSYDKKKSPVIIISNLSVKYQRIPVIHEQWSLGFCPFTVTLFPFLTRPHRSA
jgi:hypothetical protein